MALSTNPQTVPTRPADLDAFDTLRAQVQQCLQQFRQRPVTPVAARQLELQLKTYLNEAGRTLLQQEFNRCEPADKAQAAPKVRYRGDTYRRNKRTKANIATSFGPITLWSFLYLHSEDGEPGLHPLHALLGICADTTTVLAERVALWAVTHSQREVRDLLLAEHGLKWSNDRLRHLLRDFRRNVVQFREQAQVRQLLQWLQTAAQSRGGHRPVLSVGRDGVMVPMRGLGYQEASTATIAVYDRRGKRLGTVYLGQMPQAYQATLSEELTAVVERTLREWSGPLPRLVYVTDKGQAQDDYYRRVLRRMKNPRQPKQRLQWQWVLDFFHVCGYVGKLRDALFGKGGQGWYAQMRHWLRDRKQGVSQVLRSAMQHWLRSKMSKQEEQEFWKAYRYLRRHRRWMAYETYRRVGLPIGSGVTEAACKTLFTERMKRSGMRWQRESGQVIVDLRALRLSGVWSEVVQLDLQARHLPEKVSSQPGMRRNARKAA